MAGRRSPVVRFGPRVSDGPFQFPCGPYRVRRGVYRLWDQTVCRLGAAGIPPAGRDNHRSLALAACAGPDALSRRTVYPGHYGHGRAVRRNDGHDGAALRFHRGPDFYLSDLAVARDRFVSPGFANALWGLPLYYVAQLLFAYSASLES